MSVLIWRALAAAVTHSAVLSARRDTSRKTTIVNVRNGMVTTVNVQKSAITSRFCIFNSSAYIFSTTLEIDLTDFSDSVF